MSVSFWQALRRLFGRPSPAPPPPPAPRIPRLPPRSPAVRGEAASAATSAGDDPTRAGAPRDDAVVRHIIGQIVTRDLTFEEQLTGETGARREAVLHALENQFELPSLATIAQSLRESVAREDANLEEIVAKIEADASLAAKVLRLANSAYMRGGGEVESLHDAALQIGSRSLRQLIFSMRLINAANSLAPGFDWTHLWKHNFATSVLAVDLQTIFGMESHFTGGIGLIHDLGKVILSDLYPAEYAAIVQRAYDHRSAMGEEEQRVFGISHEEVGAQYVVHYGFAREIQEALLYQNTPAEAPTHRAAAALLQLANYFAKLHGLGYSGDRRYLDQEYDQLPGWRVLLEEAGADQKLMIERYENYLRSSLRSSLAKARHQVDAMFGR